MVLWTAIVAGYAQNGAVMRPGAVKSELLRPSISANLPGRLLLETVIIVTDSTLPWTGNSMDRHMHFVISTRHCEQK